MNNGLTSSRVPSLYPFRQMDTARVKALTDEILGLPEPERAELAQAVLPALLTTPAGLAGLDEALAELPDAELAALVERTRCRHRDMTSRSGSPGRWPNSARRRTSEGQHSVAR